MKISDLGPFAAPVFMLIIFGIGFGYGAVMGFAWRGVYDAFGRRVGAWIARKIHHRS